MKKSIEFGIGFLAGRPNVCKIINNYYKNIIEQGKKSGYSVNFTFFILFDLNYQFTPRCEFYNIIPAVYKNMNVKYITPEDIEEEKKILISRHKLKKEDVNLILGNGYARARNSIMYFALKRNIDYLLFWDDDEYPVANLKSEDNIEWVPQNNVLTHIQHIEDAVVTMGHRCGYMSPIPPIKLGEKIKEEEFKIYINAVSNEAVSWDKLKRSLKENKHGITFAKDKVLEKNEATVIKDLGVKNWLLASGICINLNKIDDIPPFYNPIGARGEDTFFSTWLTDKRCLSVPTYHFHDGFLKYTGIPKRKFPTKFDDIDVEDDNVGERFFNASIGWLKYKPLLIYITDRENYRKIIDATQKELELSMSKMNKVFSKCDFSVLIDELDQFDKRVEDDYAEYIKTFEAWEKFKEKEVWKIKN